MLVSHAIRARRSIKRFTDRPVARTEIETLLEAATLAPNHRLTQPWRFYVMGPQARYAYGMALGERKAKKIEDPTAAQAMRETVAQEHRALPCMIAIAVVTTDNPEQRDEDYAATMMAVQNIALAAVELGLGDASQNGRRHGRRGGAHCGLAFVRTSELSPSSTSASRPIFLRRSGAN
jgi:nitroreductase